MYTLLPPQIMDKMLSEETAYYNNLELMKQVGFSEGRFPRGEFDEWKFSKGDEFSKNRSNHVIRSQTCENPDIFLSLLAKKAKVTVISKTYLMVSKFSTF